MIQKRWFRIETAKDGSILSCDEVETKGKGSGIVRFYEAVDKADACAQAKAWQSRYRQQQREYQKRARDSARAKGLCTHCRRAKSAMGLKQCQACTDLKNAQNARWRAGEAQPRIVRDATEARAEKLARGRAWHASSLQASHVLRQLDLLSPGQAPEFRKWLVETIEAAQAVLRSEIRAEAVE